MSALSVTLVVCHPPLQINEPLDNKCNVRLSTKPNSGSFVGLCHTMGHRSVWMADNAGNLYKGRRKAL